MLISDFNDFSSEPNVEKTLRDIVGHRQVACFKVTDPLDATLPPAGRYAISDGSRQIKMDTSQQAIRQRYQVDFERSQQEVIDYLRRYQVPLVTIDTDENPNELLQQVFPETMNPEDLIQQLAPMRTPIPSGSGCCSRLVGDHRSVCHRCGLRVFSVVKALSGKHLPAGGPEVAV